VHTFSFGTFFRIQPLEICISIVSGREPDNMHDTLAALTLIILFSEMLWTLTALNGFLI
jgi:hypothetical protein